MRTAHLGFCPFWVNDTEHDTAYQTEYEEPDPDERCVCPRPWAVVKDREPVTDYQRMMPWVLARRQGIYFVPAMRFHDMRSAWTHVDALVRQDMRSHRVDVPVPGAAFRKEQP